MWTVLVSLALLGAHPDSLSRSKLVVEGASAELTIRFQTLSAIEILTELDQDGDDELSQRELDDGRELLGTYLTEHWRLLVGDAETPLVGTPEEFTLLSDALAGPFELQWMEARIRFVGPAPIDVFTVESRLFQEENPFHRDLVEMTWNGEEPVRVLFQADRPRFRYEPAHVRRPGVFSFFLELGFLHILEGYDHLAFLLALLVAAPRLRSLIGVVTAFTVAHSITLGWSALDPGGLLSAVPGRLVELAIALSIAYVACENLLRSEPRTRWKEAFCFGLLHGLGFAGFLADALAGESLVVTALFGFNLGVEAGQLLVVLAAAAVFAVLGRRSAGDRQAPGEADAPEAPPRGLVPAWFRIGSSAVVAVVALYWFAERAGWLPVGA